MSDTDGARYRALATDEKLRVLLEEERELDHDRFDLDDAWAVGSWIRATALDRGLGVGFSIAFGEQRVFHAATPGSGAVNDAWLDRKFRVVRHFAHSTLAVRTQYEVGGSTFDEEAADEQRELPRRSTRGSTRRQAAASRCSSAASSSAPSASAVWRCTTTTPSSSRPSAPTGTTPRDDAD
jgi:hypothetical protein